jgi:hypothetical protein
MTASGSVEGCLTGLCTSADFTLIDLPAYRQEIVAFNDENARGNIQLFDLITPRAALGRPYSLTADVTSGELRIELDGSPIFPPEPPAGQDPSLKVEIANIVPNLPHVQTRGQGSTPPITAGEESTILDVNVDIDTLLPLFSAGMLPPLGGTLSAGPLSLSFDLLDVEAGPTLDLTQDFEFTPTLLVDLTFSRPVTTRQGGVITPQVTSLTAPWDELPEIALDRGPVTVTPTLRLGNTFSNTTGLDIDFEITADIVKFRGMLESGPFELDTGDLALFSARPVDTTLIPVSLSQETFALEGFQTITAQPFQLGAVPEPGTLGLLSIGVLALGAVSWRRRSREVL